MSRKVAFIGHREVYQKIEDRLVDAVQHEINSGCKNFIMGCHGEFDSMALCCCEKFKDLDKDISIEVVLTSMHKFDKLDIQDKSFNAYAGVKTVMFDIEDEHYKRQIETSNKKMIDECDTLICYVDKSRNHSGAKIAMNYAKSKGLKIINLYRVEDERTFKMTKEEFWKNLSNYLSKN